MQTNEHSRPTIHLGADIGSTTTKLVALDARSHATLYSVYVRHNAHQAQSLIPLLQEVQTKFPGSTFRMAMSGSGGKAIADYLGIPYMQEVVANSIAIAQLHPQSRCAIELGGQDAKMIFFDTDPTTGALNVADMRMNGSCAGGTGAFIDEIASLLQTPVEDLNALAEAGETVYQISGRCGVYAKTDIQPLLNQGARKEDIVLSTYHAIAKQTLGGLAQGLDICAPVVFEGGPLTFNPQLIRVFAQRLELKPGDIIVPESPETIVAQGAAWSLDGMFKTTDCTVNVSQLVAALENSADALREASTASSPFFASAEDQAAFQARHALAPHKPLQLQQGQVVRAYLGIDSGSTTTKFVLLDENEQLLDTFYANNEGEPIDIAKGALCEMAARYEEAGAALEILGLGTTGYGELLFNAAFHADVHMVETVAHAVAATKYVPDASFILDIGGQDMKAIWIDNGVVTDILVNEACSSGCGSFLENFARSLGIPTHEIAAAAFRAQNPAVLGSRCTVFMNSSVVTEQRNGKTPDDIMAGLCRSIIENVFTKVIRIANTDALGQSIVVQGGTFENDAVLAAFEAHVGKPVTRAPYPGLMGAIGAALLAKQHMESTQGTNSRFIGFNAVTALTYTQQTNATCPFCTNACNRTLVAFGDDSVFVTGNRCERGLVVGNPQDESVRQQLRATSVEQEGAENLFTLREKLVFATYDAPQLLPDQGQTIGLPRVLALWDNAPFWTTFWRSLGYRIALSSPSTRGLYEQGLPAVTSDTVCFPAKLVHGAIRDLASQNVDRIWMPVLTIMQSENTQATSESMCAVVKGYPYVVRNSDNPESRFSIPFDSPLFHWYSAADRANQLCEYMQKTFGIEYETTLAAIEAGDAAQASFRTQLQEAGARALEAAQTNNTYAVVLASRPYHNDPLVNHDLPAMFTRMGHTVLPPDALPGVNEVEGLEKSRIDVVNNFHARMLGSAIMAATSPALEYVQLVSFGCGHDAYLTDEIVRLMHELGEKSPLVLKVDESDISGPLGIRVRSFIETVNMRRAKENANNNPSPVRPNNNPSPVRPPDPYPQKFTKYDRKERVILIPNTSHAFSQMMAAVFSKQGVRAVPLPIGRDRAIALGKKYVHNDICFPAQIVVGEALAELETGKYDDCEVAIGTGKYIGDCRLTHYAALLRKALDDAGYENVPIVTNDDVDSHNIHPGFIMNTASAIRIAMTLPMIDAMEELLRKIRPYELEAGSAEAAFEKGIDTMMQGLEAHGVRGVIRGFKQAIAQMKEVKYDRSNLRPTVLIVGEYLLNFHPGANHDIEKYLEANGFEIIEAKMTDVIRKSYFYKDSQIKEYGVRKPFKEATWLSVTDAAFEHAHNVCDRIAAEHPLYTRAARMPEIVQASDEIIHHTFDAGEGVLIPAEIIHNAEKGCRAFIILQPFGCLPNHVVGRGIAKRLKEMYPDAQILPLDYDPDVSFANLENRLQMLVMNARTKDEANAKKARIIAPDFTNKDGGTPLPELAAFAGTAYDLSEISTRVAACAAEVAAVATQASLLVEQAAERSSWDFAKQRAWIETNAQDAFAELQEVATHAEEVRTFAENVLGIIRTNMAAYGAPAQQLSELAQRAADLATQTAEDARAYVATAQARWETFMQTNMEAAKQVDSRINQIRADARTQISEMQQRSSALARTAIQVAHQAENL